MSMKNFNETTGNRTRDLSTCSAVPQPTAPPAACPDSVLRATINVKRQSRITDTRPLTERKVRLTPDTIVAIDKNDGSVSSFV
jgi:hypothetical protein